MFLFFLIADCSWFSSVRDQTALDEEEPSRSSIFTLCFHRDMASEKKMVLNDSVPVSLLTVRMIMQGKVSCLGFFFLHFFLKKILCCIISTHTQKPDRCQASIVACDTVILAFMIRNKQTFFLQYRTAIIFAAHIIRNLCMSVAFVQEVLTRSDIRPLYYCDISHCRALIC